MDNDLVIWYNQHPTLLHTVPATETEETVHLVERPVRAAHVGAVRLVHPVTDG